MGSKTFGQVNAGATSAMTVDFPQQMPNANYYVFIALDNEGEYISNWGAAQFSTTVKTKTGFTIRLHNQSSSNAIGAGLKVSWIAIPY